MVRGFATAAVLRGQEGEDADASPFCYYSFSKLIHVHEDTHGDFGKAETVGEGAYEQTNNSASMAVAGDFA